MPTARSKKPEGENKTNDGEKKPSFWETLPGIITATGTLIVACTGLVTALYTAGIIGTSKEPDKKVPESLGGNKPEQKAISASPINAPKQNVPPSQPTDEPAASDQNRPVINSVSAAAPNPPPKKNLAQIFTISDGEVQRLDFADADLSVAFQNMNGEQFITLHVVPATGTGVAQAAYENSIVKFSSSGNRHAVQVIGIDYANRKVTLKTSCTSCS